MSLLLWSSCWNIYIPLFLAYRKSAGYNKGEGAKLKVYLIIKQFLFLLRFPCASGESK